MSDPDEPSLEERAEIVARKAAIDAIRMGHLRKSPGRHHRHRQRGDPYSHQARGVPREALEELFGDE